MVTIEQKLTLFSKLLNQELKEEIDKEIIELEKEYEAKVAEHKYNTDKEAAAIINQARKNAEAKKIELVSRGRMSSKKEAMLTKEKVMIRFMEALIARTKVFTDTSSYEKYLKKLIDEVSELKDYKNPLVIQMTGKDVRKYKEVVLESLNKIGITSAQVSFEEISEEMIGGFIISDAILNMKVDMSMYTVIEESKERIVELITLALREAGEDGE